MRPVPTSRTNGILVAPEGMDYVEPLPVAFGEFRGARGIQSTWELTPEERIAIGEGANLNVFVLGAAAPVMALEIDSEPREIT
jgi:hypothetical protein